MYPERMTKFLTLMLLVFGLVASPVVIANDGVRPSSLGSVEAPTYFTLAEDLTLSTSVTGPFGRKTKLAPVLLKGEYVSVFTDKDGTYYRGPKDCLPNPNPNALYPALDGGLWLPRDPSKQTPRLWFYMKPMPPLLGSTVGLVVRALDRLTAGNVKKDPAEIEDLSFMERIAVAPYVPPVNTAPAIEAP